jgi:hypothetical protein
MKKTILTLLMLAFIIKTNAQNRKESGMYFGAIVGTQINTLNNHFKVNIDPTLYSLSIGAGSAYTKNNYVIGLDFVYSSAQKSNTSGEIQYIGFSNTLSFGYNFSKSNVWKIEPNLGIVLNNNQLIVQDKNNANFQNLTNNQFAGNIGLNIKAVGKNGLFTGIKLGYIVPFSGSTEWKYKVNETQAGLNDNLGAFYVQLNLGGFLSLTKK